MPRLSVLMLLVVTFGNTTASIAADRPPNIVFLFADDLGYADLGCYGHPYAKTPNIDRLAQEGTRFTQFYVTGVTCNPSRTGAMTGRFPARYPNYTADFGFGGITTITELLKTQGYRIGHFGKWHIGPETTDGTYGIDTIRVIGKSTDMATGRDDDLYSAAIEFIKENKEQPFYINVWGHATHYPVNTPPALAGKFKDVKVNRSDFSATMQPKFDDCVKAGGNLNKSMQQYLGDVWQIDRNVGRIINTIDELGLRDNTIIVFSSDHGPAPVILASKGIRDFSKNMLGYAGEFRGGKHSQYEGGIRVPFIIRWPNKVKAGRVASDSVCSFIDWLPTLCSIAGINDLPGQLDGENIADIWFGADRERTQPLYWKTSSTGSAPAIRQGNWKLHLARKQRGGTQLYDLAVDPSECKNLAAKYPEVAALLTKQLESWVSELPTNYKKTK